MRPINDIETDIKLNFESKGSHIFQLNCNHYISSLYFFTDLLNRISVKDQGDTLLDSEIMTVSSRVLHKCSYSISKDISNYDPIEFADKIVSVLCYYIIKN